MKQKVTRPGPVGVSCLTCRRRRKKCDRARPTCQRCTVGKFECLGYDSPGGDDEEAYMEDPKLELDLSRGVSSSGSSRPLRPLLPKPATQSSALLHKSIPATSICDLEHTSSELPQLARSKPLEPQTASGYNDSVWTNHLGGALDEGDTEITRQTQNSYLPQLPETYARPRFGHNSKVYQSFDNLAPAVDIQSMHGWIQPFVHPSPLSLSPLPNDTKGTIEYVVSQYERLFDLSFLTPTSQFSSQIRGALAWNLHQFDATRRTKFLGCKMFECIVDGTSRQKLGIYTRWLYRFEQQLKSTSDQQVTPISTYNRLGGLLDVCFLKIMFADNMNTYRILQETAPTFLQIMFMDSSLWLDPTNITSLSLAHVLGSTNYELARFVLLDALYSMAYGLPQVIEYDTSVSPFLSDIQPVEWIDGCPVGLKIALVDINKRCNSQTRLRPEPDWRPIEHHIMSWKSTAHATPDSESWKNIAKVAVHESWRHSLLIYLYMGVCGAKSDDYLVQASLRQVFQLIDSVKRFEVPCIDMHFLAQYLIAGVCARSEKQRDIVRAKLAATYHDGLWLLRGSDFVSVLDHLWHGAAIDGRPIYWVDYIRSREVCLPVP